MQRFCKPLPPVPARTAPYRLVREIRRLLEATSAARPAKSHRVVSIRVGNRVGRGHGLRRRHKAHIETEPIRALTLDMSTKERNPVPALTPMSVLQSLKKLFLLVLLSVAPVHPCAAETIQLERKNGTYMVPVQINHA